MAKRIVLGVDGSRGSEVAAIWCAKLAKTLGAEVVAVHAVDPSVASTPARQDLERTLADVWCRPLQDEHVDTRTLTIDADPAGALLAVADDFDADLVVVGRRGEGGFEELLLGSVPSQLALYSKRPVVIIPEES